jgi:uncharacterized surface protein with fasciclin (FAS1) repeats
MNLQFIQKTKSLVLGITALVISGGLLLTPTLVAQSTSNIVQVASGNASFSTLVTAVKAAGLVDTLSGTGPFTVLAPTNDAFAKVPAEVIRKLLLPENKATLTKILTYHVIAGTVDATQITGLTTAKTVEGQSISIAVVGGKVKLNTSTTVLTTDIRASNGIIHSIDSVLLPSDVDLSKLLDSSTLPRTGGATQTLQNNPMVLLSIVAVSIAAFTSVSFVVRRNN